MGIQTVYKFGVRGGFAFYIKAFPGMQWNPK